MNEEFSGYRTVATFGDFDYSWSEMRIYEKNGRFFYLTDSGCSCNGWNDGNYMSEQDMGELPDLDAARGAYLEWHGNRGADAGEGFEAKCVIDWLDVRQKLYAEGLR